jgi:hypothetical protein
MLESKKIASPELTLSAILRYKTAIEEWRALARCLEIQGLSEGLRKLRGGVPHCNQVDSARA